MPETEVRARLRAVQAKLRRARLIEEAASGRFRITARGRRVLADNPDGVDDTVLMELPEFRPANGHPFAQGGSQQAPGGSQRAPNVAYQNGYEAYLTGVGLADNPHPADVRAALDWENGWSQARDEQLKQRPDPQPERRQAGTAASDRGTRRASDR